MHPPQIVTKSSYASFTFLHELELIIEKEFKLQLIRCLIHLQLLKLLLYFVSLTGKGELLFPIMAFVKLCAFFSRVHCTEIALLDCWLHVHRCLCCQLLMLSRKQHLFKGFQLNFSSRPHIFSLQGSFYHLISLEQEGFKTRKK